MARQLFHFVAGEQHAQAASHNVLDAWLAIERMRERGILASEFLRLPIEAYDQAGKLLASRKFDAWHSEMMRDTYGANWREIVADFWDKV